MHELLHSIPPQQRARILHVEDEDDQVEVIRAAFRSIQDRVEFDVAKFLAEALQKLDQAQVDERPFDGVLLDLGLPDQPNEDVQTVAIVRQHTDAPIVVLTGCDRPDIYNECIRAGAVGFFLKGTVNLAELSRILILAIAERLTLINMEQQAIEAELLKMEVDREKRQMEEQRAIQETQARISRLGQIKAAANESFNRVTMAFTTD